MQKKSLSILFFSLITTSLFPAWLNWVNQLKVVSGGSDAATLNANLAIAQLQCRAKGVAQTVPDPALVSAAATAMKAALTANSALVNVQTAFNANMAWFVAGGSVTIASMLGALQSIASYTDANSQMMQTALTAIQSALAGQTAIPASTTASAASGSAYNNAILSNLQTLCTGYQLTTNATEKAAMQENLAVLFNMYSLFSSQSDPCYPWFLAMVQESGIA